MSWELRDDALAATPTGFELRVGLPWMRSLPLSCVLDLELTLAGREVRSEELSVRVASRDLAIGELAAESDTWWFVQDRLVLTGPILVRNDERYDVAVVMTLLLPYLSSGPDRPATLPFRFGRTLTAGSTTTAGAWRDVAGRRHTDTNQEAQARP